tara:strand:- start:906 stop:1340 length:435 start_codon:yes stop_codon:yes gene_type:complete
MNISKIFSLFSNNEELDGNPIDVTSYEDFTSTPVYWIGMFRKLISQYDVVSDNFILSLPSDSSLDLAEMKEAYKFMAHIRAFSYIENFNLNDEKHVDVLKRFNDELFISCLYSCLLYFEEIEEYEKCLTLKKIVDFSKNLPQKT